MKHVLAAAAAAFALAAMPVLADEPNVTTVAVGDTSPSFTANALDGKSVDSHAYAGKILVLNFWATWCPPCRQETPDMIRAYGMLHAPDVAFLGIDTTETAAIVKTFLSAKGVPYPTAIAGPEAYNGFGVAYIPTTFVIDRSGVVRARWTGELAPERLAQFVADARAGKNYVLDTPDERIAERLLDPALYRFDGNAADVTAEVRRAKANIAAVEDFANAHSDGAKATVDYSRVQSLEGTVLLAAAQGAKRVAQSPDEQVAADRLLAEADGKVNRFADAVAALRDAQKVEPSDTKLWLDISHADYRLHDYADGIASANAYVAAKPADADGFDWLGLAYQRTRQYAEAAPAYEKALALMRAAVDSAKTPSDRTDAIANVADESLDLADVYVALGDAAGARRTFAQAIAYGDRLDPKGEYGDLRRNVHERTQEGMIAVSLVHGSGKTAISIAHWTGPDLPGSLPSTIKYRLIVAKSPDAKVTLHAVGLRAGWIASFCADGLCSPNDVSVTLPESGVKTYEFQLVPPHHPGVPGTVHVRSADGTVAVVPTRS